MKTHLFLLVIFSYLLSVNSFAQSDTIKEEKLSLHYQSTVIWQYKPSFSSKYSGTNSLSDKEDNQNTLTSTIFLGIRLWKGGSFYVNPELAGGSGLSGALGIASSTNGESYRVGNPKPRISIARFYYRQIFYNDKNNKEYQCSDINQLAGNTPKKYFAVTIGKIAVPDYFDNNKFSHDPRTQFLSWGLMNNGAWDVPSNTFGYSPSVVLEWVSKKHELRYAFSLIPEEINGPVIDWHINKANSQTLEYTFHYNIKNQPGTFRILGFFTTTHMGNYAEALQAMPLEDYTNEPDISLTRRYGRTKYGFGVNTEQNINNNLGYFIRASWNDGHNEDWMYSEIDHSLSAGISKNMSNYGRIDDNLGIAFVISGLSKSHREYLEAGGNGFILGDGNLNYSLEKLAEIYYSASLIKDKMNISGTYQLVINPGYNKDRGPVSVFSVRVHFQM